MKNPNNFEVDPVEHKKSAAFIEALDILARASGLDESIKIANQKRRQTTKGTKGHAARLQQVEKLMAKKEALMDKIKEPLERAMGGRALMYAGYQLNPELSDEENLDILARGVFIRFYGTGPGVEKKHQEIKNTLSQAKIL
jgi:hypothetical protein